MNKITPNHLRNIGDFFHAYAESIEAVDKYLRAYQGMGVAGISITKNAIRAFFTDELAVDTYVDSEFGDEDDRDLGDIVMDVAFHQKADGTEGDWKYKDLMLSSSICKDDITFYIEDVVDSDTEIEHKVKDMWWFEEF